MKRLIMLIAASAMLLSACSGKEKISFVNGEFNQMEFSAEDGTSVKYNLFIPSELTRGEVYPLVVFIHDAGALSDSTAAVLSQNGAKVWASQEWQAEHPCFVLAPQFNTITVNDEAVVTPEVGATAALIEKLCREFPIDSNRIYGTGQSMGCMQTIVTAVNYPEMYAALYLVANGASLFKEPMNAQATSEEWNEYANKAIGSAFLPFPGRVRCRLRFS